MRDRFVVPLAVGRVEPGALAAGCAFRFSISSARRRRRRPVAMMSKEWGQGNNPKSHLPQFPCQLCLLLQTGGADRNSSSMATKDRKALKLARHEGVVGSFLTDPSHHFPDKDHFVVLVLLIS